MSLVMLRGVILVGIFFLSFRAQADIPSLSLAGSTKSYRLKPFCQYLVDTSGYSLDEVLTKSFHATYNPDDYLKEGYGFWVRFSVTNKSDWTNFILTIDQWSKATFYYSTASGEWRRYASGTTVKVADRPESMHRLLSFPVVIEPGATVTFYLYARNDRTLTRNYSRLYSFLDKMELEEAGFARKKYLANQLLIAFAMGISFILFVYTLALFVQNRELSFLMLAIYLVLSSLFVANIHGITTNYLFPWAKAFELPLGLVLAHSVSIFLALFVKFFLRLSGRHWQHVAILVLVGFIALSLLMSLLEQRSMWYFPRRYLELGVLLAVLSWGVYKSQQGAPFLLAAIAATSIASFISDTLAVQGTPMFVLSDLFYLGGLTLQMILFSVGASSRVGSLKAEVMKAQEEKRLLLQNQNEILNEQVKERTSRLEEAYQSITVKNEELEMQAESLNNANAEIRKLNQGLEQEVLIRTQKLEHTFNELDLFLYRSSHDMRRPLTTILGLVNLIRHENNLEEIRYLSQMIGKTVHGLDHMLQKLMVISTITDTPRSKEEINLKDLLERTFCNFRKEYSNSNFNYTINISGDVRLRAQSDLLVSGLSCLIENAILYGFEQTLIHVTANSMGDVVRITIKDNGQGIEPEYLDNVFDMYFRANTRSQGNGLGLYVVKKCVERLKGTVSLQSAVGEGTMIEIILPTNIPES